MYVPQGMDVSYFHKDICMSVQCTKYIPQEMDISYLHKDISKYVIDDCNLTSLDI